MSKWDKLLTKIYALSKDLRFDELRKVLESYGYVMNAPQKVGAVITLLEKLVVSRLRYRSMNQSKKCMLRW